MLIEPRWLIIGGVGALLGVGALVAWAAERKRREAYEQHCLIRGFNFELERPEGERRFREFFEPFNQGRSRRWGYTISGQLHGAAFTAFDYRWVTGGGEDTHTPPPRGQVAGGGRFLFWWRDQRLPKAEQLDEWLELGDQVRRRFFKR